MKKARKKRIVRRKRRISEREIMRIKRKLKKSARKLRLGAKRTGAYVYGTLRRIVGNPGGLKILGYRSGMQYLTDGRDVYRRDKTDMKHGSMRWYSTYASFPASIRAYGPLTSPRGLRGNPLSYYVGGLSSLGAKRESQRRMRTYNQIKKSIQRGNASYGELAVLQSLAKEHPKLFAGDPMMAEAGGISEAQFRRLRGNPSVTMQDIQRIVGKINSEGGGARVVPAGSGGLNLYLDRISPYDDKIIDVGHEYLLRGTKRDIYEALIKIRFVPMYHPYARKLNR